MNSQKICINKNILIVFFIGICILFSALLMGNLPNKTTSTNTRASESIPPLEGLCPRGLILTPFWPDSNGVYTYYEVTGIKNKAGKCEVNYASKPSNRINQDCIKGIVTVFGTTDGTYGTSTGSCNIKTISADISGQTYNSCPQGLILTPFWPDSNGVYTYYELTGAKDINGVCESNPTSKPTDRLNQDCIKGIITAYGTSDGTYGTSTGSCNIKIISPNRKEQAYDSCPQGLILSPFWPDSNGVYTYYEITGIKNSERKCETIYTSKPTDRLNQNCMKGIVTLYGTTDGTTANNSGSCNIKNIN